MLDDRDGQVYKTVKIGEQTWMAENLNYEVANSYCYNDSTKYCDKYGHLYTWTVAMDNAMGPVRKCTDGVCQSNFSGNIQGICPTGWRLPFIEDFDTLFLAIGGITVAGTKLKSTSGWIDDGNGINVYGFSAIPAGEKSASGYETKGYMAYFWSATNSGNFPGAYGLYFAWDDDGKAYQNVSFHYEAQSVRCIKDVSNILPIYSSSENNIESSSSASLALPCKTSKEDNCEYDSLKDNRDNKTYKTVKIGNQWWMAENLNFETDKSVCYENDSLNCSLYGRYYLWSDAIDSAGVYSKNGKDCGYNVSCSPNYPIQGICPKGWHIPDTTEINSLFSAIGGTSKAGNKLKSSSGWPHNFVCTNGNGIDSYGFTVLPACYQFDNGQFSTTTNYATFWTSMTSKALKTHAYYIAFAACSDNASIAWNDFNKNYKMTIRCIKD